MMLLYMHLWCGSKDVQPGRRLQKAESKVSFVLLPMHVLSDVLLILCNVALSCSASH